MTSTEAEGSLLRNDVRQQEGSDPGPRAMSARLPMMPMTALQPTRSSEFVLPPPKPPLQSPPALIGLPSELFLPALLPDGRFKWVIVVPLLPPTDTGDATTSAVDESELSYRKKRILRFLQRRSLQKLGHA